MRWIYEKVNFWLRSHTWTSAIALSGVVGLGWGTAYTIYAIRRVGFASTTWDICKPAEGQSGSIALAYGAGSCNPEWSVFLIGIFVLAIPLSLIVLLPIAGAIVLCRAK